MPIDIDAEAKGLEAQSVAENDGVIRVGDAIELLKRLHNHRWAVVTSASRDLATCRLTAAGLPMPSVLVTAEDASRGKPDPEGYILAAGRLGIPAARCLVFEDAPAGIDAGLGAGSDMIAIAAARPYEFDLKCPSVYDFTEVDLLVSK